MICIIPVKYLPQSQEEAAIIVHAFLTRRGEYAADTIALMVDDGTYFIYKNRNQWIKGNEAVEEFYRYLLFRE